VASVDVRTRTTASIRAVDPAAFLGDELPVLIAERAELAVPGARELEVRSLGVVVEGRTWVVAFDGDRLSVAQADELPADVQVALRVDAGLLQDLVNDLLTPVGLLASGQLDLPVGRLERLLDWWVVLRSLLDGRRAHVAGDVDFRDPDGGSLDLHQSFALDTDDDRRAAAHFLGEAGFLHLRGMLDPQDMAAISAEMDAAASHYEPGDGRSWWATTEHGEQRLVRMQAFQQRSPTLERVMADERFQAIGALTDDGHVHGKPGGNPSWAEALIKPIGVVEGISDVPWHKDCSLGSHSYRCCSLTVGLSVTGADAESGQLRVVPGSHRAHLWPSFVRKGLDLPQLDLPTATGDVTVHLSCTLHMSQPPVTRERRVVYTDFMLPADEDAWDLNESQLKKVREAAPLTVSQRPGHVTG
jgi:hypothetical protein